MLINAYFRHHKALIYCLKEVPLVLFWDDTKIMFCWWMIQRLFTSQLIENEHLSRIVNRVVWYFKFLLVTDQYGFFWNWYWFRFFFTSALADNQYRLHQKKHCGHQCPRGDGGDMNLKSQQGKKWPHQPTPIQEKKKVNKY